MNLKADVIKDHHKEIEIFRVEYFFQCTVSTAHLGFYGIPGNMQFFSNFFIGKRFKYGKFQDFPALVGQFFYGKIQLSVLFLLIKILFISRCPYIIC